MPHSEETGPLLLPNLQDATCLLVRMFRSAHLSGQTLSLNARTAGSIADCIEELSLLADDRTGEAVCLKAEVAKLYRQVIDLSDRFAMTSELLSQIRQRA